ncbi:MAG TPA: GNAT family N-acetyltransferase [Acidimicrobiales bacterium]
MRTRILRGGRQWEAVGPVWSALAAEVPPRSHLQTAEWAHALTDEYHTDDARWFVVEDDARPLAVLPFRASVRRVGPVRVRVLASERLTDGLVHPRLQSGDLRRAVLTAAREAGEPVDVLSLDGMRPGSAFAALAGASAARPEAEPDGGYSIIDTDMSGDEWEAAASRNLRAGLRKARNRFGTRGQMTITAVTAADDVAAAFDEYVAIEASGWKASSGALAIQPIQHAVLRHFLLASAAAGGTRVAVRTLRLDGRPAAAQLVAVTGGTLALLKVAYHDALSDLSPSNLLMADLVRTCCERADVQRIDLVTSEPWHERWHAVGHPTYRVRDVNPRRAGGLASVAGLALARLRARLPRG